MNIKEINIVESAFSVFSRYGVQRTTMNDIAKEAGIARQTLYNTFSNKDEVLCATIRLFKERTTVVIQQELEETTDLSSKLDVFFKHLALEPYQLLHSTPHAEDIIQGMSQLSRDEIRSTDEHFRSVIESTLQSYQSSIEKAGLSVFGLSDLVRNSMTGAKHQARDIEHLTALLNSLKAVVLKCTH
ncbi:TetR/AcrR family transcriptional regulator [Vibrio hannami]|uniref:TetR/AcrR family transcriptional regulator n=1 Tax=Vibrio hannami TaxID=2717094 RepID=UPI00240F23D6|nr:TetR/AcrR family transcriptional regulator [Vibrio hannami]MDG3087908.1 TetR/AcrR family transcriptional regulator [Vibrio hannami]